MTHEKAFELCSDICPQHIGLRWNTTQQTGCDTAWAVADQYDEDETSEAKAALRQIARGLTPDGWERHQ